MVDVAPIVSLMPPRRSFEVPASLASSVLVGAMPGRQREALPIALPLSSVLPEGGFPQGSVVELASPANLGRSVSVALAACAAAQKASFERGPPMAWCPFFDPDQTPSCPSFHPSCLFSAILPVLTPLSHPPPC